MFRMSCFAALFTATVAVSLPAVAQTDEERAGARAAATEGAQAFDERRYADAIDLFNRAEQLVHAPPHLLYLARAHEKLGQLVRSREVYIKLSRENLSPNSPQVFRDAQDAAKKELSELEPRIPYVTATVQGAGATDPRVLMDGKRVPDALVGVPRPVDPGKHTFQAFAEGMESAENTVTVKEGGRETLVLTLQPAAPGSVPPPDPATPGGGGEQLPPPETDAGGVSGMRIGAYTAFGVGAVGAIIGVAFLVQKGSKADEADSLYDSCVTRGCTPAEQAEITRVDEEGDSAGTTSVIGFVVGGLGIGTGITLLILDSQKKSSAALELTRGDVALRPFVGYQSAGLTGTF